jgi:Erythromycin esterase
MAENVKWIADENPGARLIVWAHNGHISNTGYFGTVSMGSYLRKAFGSQLVNFGFAFNEGAFQAVEQGKGLLRSFTVEPAPDGQPGSNLGGGGYSIVCGGSSAAAERWSGSAMVLGISFVAKHRGSLQRYTRGLALEQYPSRR